MDNRLSRRLSLNCRWLFCFFEEVDTVMKPTVEFLKRKFDEFNELIFDGRLPSLPISVGNARTSLGGLHFERRRTMFGGSEMSNFHIRISSRFDLDESEIEDVLIHEMIHYHILYHKMKDTSPHGVVFRKMMSDINRLFGRHIAVTHKWEQGSQQPMAVAEARYFCICQLYDGTWGITCVPRQRVLDYRRLLPQSFRLRSAEWYVSSHPFFSRFPKVRSLKIFKTTLAELEEPLKNAKKLVFK